MLELATLIFRHARYRPDATAVVFGDERLSYAQFGARVARTANLLRSLGIGKGDKVATVLGNSREALELVWAVPAVGAALVPLSPLLMAAGLASLLRDSDAKCLVSQRAMLPALEAIRSDLAPFLPGRVLLIDGASGDFGDYGALTAAQDDAYKRPDLTAQAIRDGWIFTGDMGYVDEEGFLYLVDRKKDMIDSGGMKVYPRDVEEIAARHPAIREVAVFGVPHDKWGETPLAAVILREGARATAEELRSWINERVAARYQRVSEVAVRKDFPRSAAGKTLKREMREPYWAARERKI